MSGAEKQQHLARPDESLYPAVMAVRLTHRQVEAVNKMVKQEGRTASDIFRAALDLYLDEWPQ